jgi:valyl-tRNA synthetase
VWTATYSQSVSRNGKKQTLGEISRTFADVFGEFGLSADLWAQIDEESDQHRLHFCARNDRARRTLEMLGAMASCESDEIGAQFADLNLTGRKLEAAASFCALLDANLQQDPDVLDTWFSSALWPISTMGWPDPAQSPEFKGMLEAFNPSSSLSTAREIITLWVSRMVMFNRYFRAQDLGQQPGSGPLPFGDVYIHAMIQDGEGRKMSKSLGNGVDPLDIIDSHGADAMRFTLVNMTTQTQDVRMPVDHDAKSGKNTSPKFDIGRNFCNKLWNASRFVIGMLESESAKQPVSAVHQANLVDRWMLSRLATGLEAVNAALKEYQFSDYAQTMYDLLWRDFCDWYLEAIKPTVAADGGQRAVLAHALQTIVRMLHPVTPFITEAIWERLREIQTAPVDGVKLVASRKGGMLCTAGWPLMEPPCVMRPRNVSSGACRPW